MLNNLVQNIKSNFNLIYNTIDYLYGFSFELETRVDQTKNSYNDLWDNDFSYHKSTGFKEFQDFTYTLTDNIDWYCNKMSDLENKLFDFELDSSSYYEHNSFEDIKAVLDGGLRSSGVWSWQDRLNYVKENFDTDRLSYFDNERLKDYLLTKDYLVNNKKDVFDELINYLA